MNKMTKYEKETIILFSEGEDIAHIQTYNAGLMLGISTGTEAIQMMMVAFVIFVIPHFAEWLLIRIAAANYRLREFIKS